MNIINDFLVEQNPDEIKETRELNLNKNKTLSFIEKKRRADGSIYISQVMITPIDYENEKITLSVNIDITEQKRSELEIQQQIYALDNSAIVSITDKDGTIIYCNDMFCKISKYSQELIAMNLGERYGIPSVALRYSIVQGSRQSFYNAYSGACRIFSLSYYFDKAPTVYEDGLMNRDFVNIHDVVDANLLVLEKEKANGNVYCVGGGKAYTILEFAKTVAKVFGKEHIKPNIPGEYRFGDTRNACSDISKIKKLGWKTKCTIEDSIQEYKEYLEEQTDIEDILEYAEKNMKSLKVIRKVKK